MRDFWLPKPVSFVTLSKQSFASVTRTRVIAKAPCRSWTFTPRASATKPLASSEAPRPSSAPITSAANDERQTLGILCDLKSKTLKSRASHLRALHNNSERTPSWLDPSECTHPGPHCPKQHPLPLQCQHYPTGYASTSVESRHLSSLQSRLCLHVAEFLQYVLLLKTTDCEGKIAADLLSTAKSLKLHEASWPSETKVYLPDFTF